MTTTRLTAVLVGLAAIAVLATDASAYYHPGMGAWMSRDPGTNAATPAPRIGDGGGAPTGNFVPRDQYRDGLNLHQYVRSRPTTVRDPSGLEGENEAECVCGPDVTAWFRHELANQAEYAANVYGHMAQSEMGTPNMLIEFARFAKTKMEMSDGMEYRSTSCWASGSKDDNKGNCHAAVTLCGKCTRMKNLGNIVYGYAGLSAWSTATLDTAFNEGSVPKNNRQWDSYKAGKMIANLADEKTFCATINQFTNQQYWRGDPANFNSWQSCTPCSQKYVGWYHQISDADVVWSRRYRRWLEDDPGPFVGPPAR